MKMKSLLALAFASLCTWQTAWADDVVANVTLKEKNSLSSEILAISGIDDLKTVTHLTVTTNEGVALGDEDWSALQTMEALVVLDLSNATGEAVPNDEFHNHCKNLTTVKLPKGLTSIGAYAFSQKGSLVTIEVPSTVTSIGQYAFNYCSALEDCDLSACKITEIPYQCFYNCEKLKPFTIPETVTSIGYSAMQLCRNFSSPLPQNISYIGTCAFDGDAMTNIDVVIAEGVTVGSYAFRGTGIKSIELPSTCYDRAYYFDDCANLQTVTLKSPTVVTNTSAVSNASNVTLQVPSHLVAAYKANTAWSQYKDVVAISPAVTDYTVNADLNLSNSSMRMEGTPNVFFTEDASLTVAGNAAQAFGNFTASAKLYPYGYDKGFKILNESASITTTGFSQRIYTTYSKSWYFLSLPFDFKISDVTAESGAFVIRTYDGNRRNTENSSTGNWSGNLTGDDEVKSGTGFILQTSEETWVTFTAKAGSTNYAFSKESDEVKIPLAANNTNSDASAANTGWNMVGNPYLAFYNIHKLNYTAPFAVYSYGSYKTYSPDDDDYALEPLQALFVQCPNGIESIDFPAEGRQLTKDITSQNGARLRTPGSRQLFDIEVSDGTLSDKTRLVVNAEATADYEIGRDASKFFDGGSLTPQIYSFDAQGTQYAINERPALSGTLSLGILFAEDGEYTLSAQRNDIGQVILTDHETGIRTNLQQHAYTFDAKAGTCEGRFTLAFGSGITGISTMQAIDKADTEVYTLGGTLVGTTTDGLQQGVYVVRRGQHTQKVIII